MGFIPGSGRSPRVGKGNPLQYPCLGNPMDREVWQATYSPWGHTESDMTKHDHEKCLSSQMQRDDQIDDTSTSKFTKNRDFPIQLQDDTGHPSKDTHTSLRGRGHKLTTKHLM